MKNSIFNTNKISTFDIDIIVKIQQGNKTLLDNFISKYKPFIKRVVKSNIFVYDNIENTDEYSIGLIAFYESIKAFDTTRKSNFFSFSELIIKRRLIDFKRKNAKLSNECPFTSLENPDDNNALSLSQLIDKKTHVDSNNSRIEIVEEISHFRNELLKFDIDIYKLPTYVPQHSDSKNLALSIAKLIIVNKPLLNQFLKEKKLPYKKIIENIKVSRKTISKHRKYIMSICLVYTNGFDYLRNIIDIREIGGDFIDT